MKSIHIKDFRAEEDVVLNQVPTILNISATEAEKKKELRKISKALGKLQDKMYANNRYGVLIVLQGMDTSGKDSLIKQVFKNFNARGVNVYSFKQPTSAELEHDYLWRHYIALPEKGKFAVFNRSHYENVLVSRVHPELLLNENLPGIASLDEIPTNLWRERYAQINNFERHIAQNGVIVLKFFLHISKEEQRKRLLRRLNVESHNWKFSPSDLDERQFWDAYQKYYEETISSTTHPHAPWYVVPADDKCVARVVVAKAILKELEKYNFREPEVNEEVLENIQKYKKKLENES